MEQRTPLFNVGQQYMSSGKHPRLCTVIDIYTTYNVKGELVKVRYVSEHDFIGQKVTDYDVVEITIAKGKVNVVSR